MGHFERNCVGNRRTIVVGDVHGCLQELKELLKACQFQNETDELVFVGDLIGKGPDSLEVLKFIKALNARAVIGNHELSFLAHQKVPSQRPDWTALSREMGEELEAWVSYIQSWPSYIEEESFLVVHAGLCPGRAPDKTPLEILATIRTWDGEGKNLNNSQDPAWHELYSGQKLVVYGHWAMQGLLEKPNSIGLDSGCVYGGKLSALILPDKKIIQVPSLQPKLY